MVVRALAAPVALRQEVLPAARPLTTVDKPVALATGVLVALVAASRQLPATLETPVALARNSVAASARAAAVAAHNSMEPPAGLAVFMAAAVVEYLALALLALSSSRIMRLPGV